MRKRGKELSCVCDGASSWDSVEIVWEVVSGLQKLSQSLSKTYNLMFNSYLSNEITSCNISTYLNLFITFNDRIRNTQVNPQRRSACSIGNKTGQRGNKALISANFIEKLARKRRIARVTTFQIKQIR